ncbi:MAG: hypothetical protein ACOCZH_02590 [Phototrophicaceae bacterium]
MTVIDWQGFDAWEMQNDGVRVVIVPALGAKIASLVDKVAAHEWLAPPTNPVRARTYGDTFTDHDLAGWDEMFPTIVECPSPHDASVTLPDHGEVWALPWDVMAQTESMLTLRVQGMALDYTLTRTATLLADGLRLDYTLENRTGRALPFLWAAHPLFNADAHTTIELPGVERVVNVMDDPALGAVGAMLDWPTATLADGVRRSLNVAGPASNRDCRKFYVPPEQVVSAASLRQGDTGRGLTMRWDAATAPYLGVWVDEGTYSRTTTAALEPGSGYYDSLALAQRNQRVATVAAGEQVGWWLDVRLGDA